MRKLWIGLLVLGLVFGLSCKKEAQKAEEAPKAELAQERGTEEEGEVVAEVKLGELPDEIGIELLAQATYLAEKHGDAVKAGQEWQEMCKKHGVTEEELSAWQAKRLGDPQVTERLQKRVAALKAGK